MATLSNPTAALRAALGRGEVESYGVKVGDQGIIMACNSDYPPSREYETQSKECQESGRTACASGKASLVKKIHSTETNICSFWCECKVDDKKTTSPLTTISWDGF